MEEWNHAIACRILRSMHLVTTETYLVFLFTVLFQADNVEVTSRRMKQYSIFSTHIVEAVLQSIVAVQLATQVP